MNKVLACFLALCMVLTLNACSISQNESKDLPDAVKDLRSDYEKYEFLGVNFYLPSQFSQSNIFADTDTGRITYTDAQGITVFINVSETSYIEQYYNGNLSDAQSYAQVYYDANRESGTLETELSSQYDVPYIRVCGEDNGITQYGFMGFYQSGSYCATVSVYTEDENIFADNEEKMLNYCTIASFKH